MYCAGASASDRGEFTRKLATIECSGLRSRGICRLGKMSTQLSIQLPISRQSVANQLPITENYLNE